MASEIGTAGEESEQQRGPEDERVELDLVSHAEKPVPETDRRDELQELAPEREDGLFLVPKVIE